MREDGCSDPRSQEGTSSGGTREVLRLRGSVVGDGRPSGTCKMCVWTVPRGTTDRRVVVFEPRCVPRAIGPERLV